MCRPCPLRSTRAAGRWSLRTKQPLRPSSTVWALTGFNREAGSISPGQPLDRRDLDHLVVLHLGGDIPFILAQELRNHPRGVGRLYEPGCALADNRVQAILQGQGDIGVAPQVAGFHAVRVDRDVQLFILKAEPDRREVRAWQAISGR